MSPTVTYAGILTEVLERTESWRDNETGEKRTKNGVVVDIPFGEVGASLNYLSARIELADRAAAQAS